ncbi:DUF4157 domain-containing protein [Deinococcus sp. JMULE3]|uniref:eCIS core domain-containing protein n=1 Tax=Deinococcus sp. JMULE3 TaxID=2518341 RepID=UPI0015752CBD|nr:DUF4157 domain-containing protein [Deinococcus sp. JMULE3]NTY00636.1 DUF4157 domain-containing protein [Deinococcus sp. JMULE3]
MSERVHLLQRKASRVRAAQGALHRPAQEPSGQALAVQRLLSTPMRAQGQAVRPVLRAAALQRQEEARLSSAREVVQRQVAALGGVSGVQREVQTPVPARPVTPSDWVTVMRHRAERVEGQRLDTRTFGEFQTLQRQVAQSLGQGFRRDRGEPAARYATYGEHLATLQRHALSAPVSRVVLGMVPPAERTPLQRATDAALQRQMAQEQAALNFDTLASLQRQLAELDAETTQPVWQRIQARRGAGNPLPEAIQRHLEQGLNHDLGRVRIHDDAEADKLAKGVNAVAFTTGTDIFFQAGRFNPNTQTGLELLAHEVTHTVQQSQGRVGRGIDPDAGLESEARNMGAQLSRTLPRSSGSAPARPLTSLSRTTPNVVQRKAAAPATASKWRQSGKLRGHPPVRDEANPPNPNVVEDEREYQTLLAGARTLLQAQRARAGKLKGGVQGAVQDYNFWFAKVYSFVTENEIKFAESRVYDYPSYVMQCVLYFDKVYSDNLKAFKAGRSEAHWHNAFKTAAGMQSLKDAPLDVAPAIFSMVAAMLAHIRFDLPRAEAWVYQSYKSRYNAKTSDFRADFFRMSGVFDMAASSMMTVIQNNVGTASKGAVEAMKTTNLTDEMMRTALGADMGLERLETWRRMEAMVQQGRIPRNPYTLKGGQLIGDVTAGSPNARITSLQQLVPAKARPSMTGIQNSYAGAMVKAGAKVLMSPQALGTLDDEMKGLEGRYGKVSLAAQAPVDERAAVLMSLSRAPAVELKAGFSSPMSPGGVIQMPSPRDDRLIVTIMRGALEAGDLPLMLNMADSYLVLSKMENEEQWQQANKIMIMSYYPTLDVWNATALIQKWNADQMNPRRATAIRSIQGALPAATRQQVNAALSGRP